MTKKHRNRRQKTVYLSDAEYQRVRDKIGGSGIGFSGFCRGLLSSQKLIDRRSIPIDQFRQLSAIGNNLNQLARVANETHEIPPGFRSLFDQLKAQLEHIKDGLQ